MANNEEAKRLALRLLQVLEAEQVQEASPTVQELFEWYMRNHGDGARSAKRMRQLYQNHLSYLGETRAAAIKPADVLSLKNQIGNKIGHASANRVLEILRAAYNKAIKWEFYTGANPCLNVPLYTLESRERYLSSKAEISRFMKALDSMRSSTFRNFIKAALFTAARVANVQSMRWQDLDLENRIWHIPHLPKLGMTTKAGKSISIPLIDEAIAAIEGQHGKHPVWVFPGKGATGHIVNPARAWARLCAKAKITNLRMHDLRRTMGSWQANTGTSLHIIGKSLGHNSLRATYIYGRLQLDPVRQAMDKAAKAMLS
ncbi:MAG: site-specific integrase [Patescibacteria group bacterium]|nr:site-specific integrase [Patescibacteria group bacterium]